MFERRINAHLGAALAVDWHPDGHHIASCGRDRKIKVSLFTPIHVPQLQSWVSSNAISMLLYVLGMERA